MFAKIKHGNAMLEYTYVSAENRLKLKD